ARLNPGWSSRCDGWRSDSGHRRTSSVVFLNVRSLAASLRTAARSHSGTAAQYAVLMNKKLMAAPPSRPAVTIAALDATRWVRVSPQAVATAASASAAHPNASLVSYGGRLPTVAMAEPA